MSWIEELDNLESTQEPRIEQIQTSDDCYPSQKTSIPHDFYVPYPAYANNKTVLEELFDIGEDASEGYQLNEKHWAISWFNPINLQTLLETNQLKPTPDDYQALKESLGAMQSAGYDVSSVILTLERTFAKLQLQASMHAEMVLSDLNLLLKQITPNASNRGDMSHEK